MYVVKIETQAYELATAKEGVGRFFHVIPSCKRVPVAAPTAGLEAFNVLSVVLQRYFQFPVLKS